MNITDEINNNYLTIPEVCKLFHRTHPVVHKYLKKGNRYSDPIPFITIKGRKLVHKKELKNFIL